MTPLEMAISGIISLASLAIVLYFNRRRDK
jgi:hypothetical protein